MKIRLIKSSKPWIWNQYLSKTMNGFLLICYQYLYQNIKWHVLGFWKCDKFGIIFLDQKITCHRVFMKKELNIMDSCYFLEIWTFKKVKCLRSPKYENISNVLLNQKYVWKTIDFLMHNFEILVSPNRSGFPTLFGKKREFTMVESW